MGLLLLGWNPTALGRFNYKRFTGPIGFNAG
jgi:hypothetical protein